MTPDGLLQFSLWCLLGTALLAYLWLKGTGMGPRYALALYSGTSLRAEIFPTPAYKAKPHPSAAPCDANITPTLSRC